MARVAHGHGHARDVPGLTRTGPNAGDNLQWTPSASVTDLAANPMSTTVVTGSNGTF